MESDVNTVLRGGVAMTDQQTDNVFWIYLISTSNDMEVEKNMLYSDVFPKIQQICQHKGLHLQVIEIQHGNTFEASPFKSRHMKSRCHCILALLGEKRGAVSLPRVINAKEFNVLMKEGERLAVHLPGPNDSTEQNVAEALPDDQAREAHLRKDMQASLEFLLKHYQKDLNSIPPRYVLQPNHASGLGMGAPGDVQGLTEKTIIFCLEKMARMANSANILSSEALLKYVYPALETVAGLLNSNSSSSRASLITVKRHFQGAEIVQLYNHQRVKSYFDLQEFNGNGYRDENGQTNLNELERELALSGSSLFYSVDWKGDGVNLNSPEHAQYIAQMREGVLHELLEVVNGIDMEETGLIRSADNGLIEDVLAHAKKCENICKLFSGQQEILSQIRKRLVTKNLKLLLYGEPGTGKTFLCGKIAETFSQLHGPSSVKLYRFLEPYGTSNQDHALIGSISRQLHKVVQKTTNNHASVIPETCFNAEESLECLLVLLSKLECPCLIVLDGIENVHHSEFLLPGLLGNLPANVSCVLSTSSDIILDNLVNGWKLGSIRPLKMLNDRSNNLQDISGEQPSSELCVAKVSPCSNMTSVVTINRILTDSRRSLTAYQKDQVMTVAKSQSPLFTQLLAREASTWPSFVKNDWVQKTLVIYDLLDKFFTNMTAKHGMETVLQVIGYLTSSKCGLSEIDLFKLLDASNSPQYSAKQRRKLPCSALEVLEDLKLLLSETQNGQSVLLSWKHSCVADFIVDKFMADAKCQLHRDLADYYIAAINSHPQASSLLELSSTNQHGIEPRLPGKDIARAFVELPRHLIYSSDTERLHELLLNPEWVYAKLNMISIQSVLEDFELASHALENPSYSIILEAMCCVIDAGDIYLFTQDLLHHLQPHSSKYPELVGKMCERIIRWLTKEKGNRFVMCIGPQSSSGPLLKSWKVNGAKMTISTKTMELFSVSQRGFLMCYDLVKMKVCRVKRLPSSLPFGTCTKLSIHHRQCDTPLLAIYCSTEISLFCLDTLECIKTIQCSQDSLLSPATEYLVSSSTTNGIVLQSVLNEEIAFNSSTPPGQDLRHLLFSDDDKYVILVDVKPLPNSVRQSVVKVLNTTTRSVTALSQFCLPVGFQVKACVHQTHSILVGVLKTPNDISEDIPDDLQRVLLFHLSTSCKSLDIKLPVHLTLLECDSGGDQFIGGNETEAFVYGLPEGTLSCKIESSGSKDVIIRGARVIFNGSSTIKIYSSRTGHLLNQWNTMGANTRDIYWLNEDGSRLVKFTSSKNTALVHVWGITEPPNTPRQDILGWSLHTLVYCQSNMLLAGVSSNGDIALMDTSKKALRWRFNTTKRGDNIDSLFFSLDGSLLLVLGSNLSLYDISEDLRILFRYSVNLKSRGGRFSDVSLSKNNKVLSIVERDCPKGDLLHVLQLDQPDALATLYTCVSNKIVLGKDKVLFLKEHSTGETVETVSTDEGLCQLMVLLKGNSTRLLDVKMVLNKLSVFCFNHDESQIALVTETGTGQSSAQAPQVTIFDCNDFKIIDEFTASSFQNLDVNMAMFLGHFIVLFTSSKVIKLDLLSGIFSEIVSTELQNPIASKDENFLVAVSKVGEVYLVNLDSSEILVKYPLPQGINMHFMASSHLDKLYFFVPEMTHPFVLMANEDLRQAMLLDKMSYEIPNFEDKISETSLSGRVENVSRVILAQSSHGRYGSSEAAVSQNSDSRDVVQSVEIRNGGPTAERNHEIENKAYFAKHSTESRGPLSQLSSDNVRLSETLHDKNRLTDNGHNVNDTGTSLTGERQLSPSKEDSKGSVKFNSADIAKESSPRVLVDNKRGPQSSDSESDTESGSDSHSESGSSGSYTTSDSESSASSASSGSTTDSGSSGSISTSGTATAGEPALVNNNKRHHSEQHSPGEVNIQGAAVMSKQEQGTNFDITVTSSDVSGMAPKPTKQSTSFNYFTSSESEEEYDGGAEDNTISDMEGSRLSHPGRETEQTLHRTADTNSPHGSDTSTAQSDEGEGEGLAYTNRYLLEADVPQRRPLVHRPTSYNYFMSDEEEEFDGVKPFDTTASVNPNPGVRRTSQEADFLAKDNVTPRDSVIPGEGNLSRVNRVQVDESRRMNLSADIDSNYVKKDNTSKACILM